MRLIDAARARLRLLFSRHATETRMDEEFRFHLDMEAERLVREEKLAPDEARRRALVAFGGVQGHREALRDGRGLAALGGLTLDLRLGLRMIRKYPGLTAVAVCGIAMAVAFASVMFTLLEGLADPTLPFPEGERIVGIRIWDRRAHDHAPSTVRDLAAWRQELTSLAELGGLRMIRRNVVLPGAPPEPIDAAEMTASAFRITRVAPLLGRYVVEDDERVGAPPVVVLGYDLWRTQFERDPSIIGRVLRVGRTDHTIIGIMPRGFGFPVRHQVWIPLRADPLALAGDAGPDVLVFGRLSSGATPEAALGELTTVNRRRVAESPGARGDVEPRIVNFAALVGVVDESEEKEAAVLEFLIPSLNTLLLIVICINVAVLVYARTATREAEFAVRISLGASRRRIVGQLFAEALVLAGTGSAVGLLVATTAYRLMRRLLGTINGPGLPFWMPAGLAPGAVLFVVGLTLLAALIIGVVPARHALGQRVRETLSELSAGASIRLGRVWTVLIVSQVAIVVAVLPELVYLSASYGWYSVTPTGLPDEEFLVARLERSDVPPTGTSGAPRSLESLVEREPGVTGATFSSHVPGREAFTTVEVEEASGGATYRAVVRTMAVAADFFEVFGVPILRGRPVRPGDAAAESGGVIVNETFVREILNGGHAVGRRVRRAASREDAEPEPWRVVVGVVPDFPHRMNPVATQARMYDAMEPASTPSAVLTARVPAGPMVLGGRLRRIAAGIDPELQLRDIQPLDRFYHGVRAGDRWTSAMMGLVTLCVLILSAAGMYALMSVTVTRRRREIGIRSALGAQPGRLVASILGRALVQLAIGATAGMLVAALLQSSGGEFMGGHAKFVLPAILAMLLMTATLAALGPARRSLRIQPAEALKAE